MAGLHSVQGIMMALAIERSLRYEKIVSAVCTDVFESRVVNHDARKLVETFSEMPHAGAASNIFRGTVHITRRHDPASLEIDPSATREYLAGHQKRFRIHTASHRYTTLYLYIAFPTSAQQVLIQFLCT